jgi:parvulin-like peptidyl-prolyl isomerase
MDAPLVTPPRKRLSRRLGLLLAGGVVIALCLVARHYWGAEPAAAEPPSPQVVAPEPSPAPSPATARPRSAAPALDPSAKVAAVVNNEPISREELAQECLRHYGKQVLESLTNKLLIEQECKRRNVAITQQEVSDEIERMSSKFGLPVKTWLEMLKKERGISPQQYAADIIWPTLALRRLAGERLQVTPQEVDEEYQRQYGPAVKARVIVLPDPKTAEVVRAEAIAKPDDFGNLAKEKSVDAASASLNGVIPPIRRHIGDPQVEQVVFNLKDGDISPVIPAGDQFLVLKRESLLPPTNMRMEQVQERLEEMVRDRKMRKVAHEVFRTLQSGAVVRNVYNDTALRTQMPGIAAVINDRQVTVAELAEMCLQRHGEEVLDGTINRKMIDQAVRRQKMQITDADLDAEIARAASVSIRPKADGSPDVESWLKVITEQQGITVDVYRRDSVWPTVALKKLAGASISISDEDLQRGYDANYGQRVRCRAIVLNNLRRAQQVWEMAREKPTLENFGDLAEKFSVEAGSQALRGEVPPIQRHGGQPLLEKDAFAMQPGQISGIIDAGEGRFVILFCEGRTEPVKVDFAQVRDLIAEDIREKKLRLAMASYFDKLQDAATVDNYLAGTSRSPAKKGEAAQPKASAQRREGSALQR